MQLLAGSLSLFKAPAAVEGLTKQGLGTWLRDFAVICALYIPVRPRWRQAIQLPSLAVAAWAFLPPGVPGTRHPPCASHCRAAGRLRWLCAARRVASGAHFTQ